MFIPPYNITLAYFCIPCQGKKFHFCELVSSHFRNWRVPLWELCNFSHISAPQPPAGRPNPAPSCGHCFSRRQQVTGLPYRQGMSCHRQPVRSPYRMPFNVRRSSARGLPRRRRSGESGGMAFHWASVVGAHGRAPLSWPASSPSDWP
jgi:hypothetical protein